MDPCPSGRQLEISWGDQRATVGEVGGGFHRCEVGDRSVFDPYPIDIICDGAHGSLLIPWPNRLVDGQYGFNDEHQLAACTEPVDGTAYDFRESRLGGTDGRTVEVWAEDGYRIMDLYTGDTLAAFGHHLLRATQVDALTVAAGGSYMITRVLAGFCETRMGPT